MGIIIYLYRKHFNYENFKLDSYCDICEVYVKENTKHCKHCNRLFKFIILDVVKNLIIIVNGLIIAL